MVLAAGAAIGRWGCFIVGWEVVAARRAALLAAALLPLTRGRWVRFIGPRSTIGGVRHCILLVLM